MPRKWFHGRPEARNKQKIGENNYQGGGLIELICKFDFIPDPGRMQLLNPETFYREHGSLFFGTDRVPGESSEPDRTHRKLKAEGKSGKTYLKKMLLSQFRGGNSLAWEKQSTEKRDKYLEPQEVR